MLETDRILGALYEIWEADNEDDYEFLEEKLREFRKQAYVEALEFISTPHRISTVNAIKHVRETGILPG